jgi:hypothetical protein
VSISLNQLPIIRTEGSGGASLVVQESPGKTLANFSSTKPSIPRMLPRFSMSVAAFCYQWQTRTAPQRRQVKTQGLCVVIAKRGRLFIN